MPPTHSPLRLEAAILSRMRSEVTSRSNWANDSSTFSVSRPIDVVVLNCCVTETKDTLCLSKSSTGLSPDISRFGYLPPDWPFADLGADTAHLLSASVI